MHALLFQLDLQVIFTQRIVQIQLSTQFFRLSILPDGAHCTSVAVRVDRCSSCSLREQNKKAPKIPCNGTRKNSSRCTDFALHNGLCGSCYKRDWRAKKKAKKEAECKSKHISTFSNKLSLFFFVCYLFAYFSISNWLVCR